MFRFFLVFLIYPLLATAAPPAAKEVFLSTSEGKKLIGTGDFACGQVNPQQKGRFTLTFRVNPEKRAVVKRFIDANPATTYESCGRLIQADQMRPFLDNPRDPATIVLSGEQAKCVREALAGKPQCQL